MAIAPAPTSSRTAAAPGLHLVATAETPAPSPTACALARRLRLAVYDLGLEGFVGSGWVNAEPAGIGFASLTITSADRLVRHLEDLAVAVGAETAGGDTTSGDVADGDAASSGSYEDSWFDTGAVATESFEQLTLFDGFGWGTRPHPAEIFAGREGRKTGDAS